MVVNLGVFNTALYGKIVRCFFKSFEQFKFFMFVWMRFLLYSKSNIICLNEIPKTTQFIIILTTCICK